MIQFKKEIFDYYRENGFPYFPVDNSWRKNEFLKFINFDNSNNGVPQPGWILDNFLHGQHGGYQQDFNNTYTLMDEFLENTLPNRMQEYINKMVWHTFTSGL
jgi:hypothetical protein